MHSRRTAADFLKQADQAAALLPKAVRILELREALLDALPQSLARSCSIANVKQGKVVIFAVNSASAAKLKLMAPLLCQRLSRPGREVTSVIIHAQPPAPCTGVGPKQAWIGEGGANALNALGESLPESSLKSIVQALAARARTTGSR
ncbi:MAG: DUF721 domain-containing protein [Burkholderiales bacterium]|nr:DUF721 domain-containing protein [Burkholderiales bacterium]